MKKRFKLPGVAAVFVLIALYLAPISLRADASALGTPAATVTPTFVTITVPLTSGNGTASGATTTGAPTITLFSPNTIGAGQETQAPDYSTSGNITFTDATIPFSISGTNLTGATLTSDNTGITFTVTNVTPDGTTVTGNILSKASALDGTATVTLTNGGGQTVTQSLPVTITGTQYLERAYNGSVEFVGDWPAVMPDPHVTELKTDIDQGLAIVQSGSYKQLNILPVIYSDSDWNLSACGNTPEDTSNLSGCASPVDNIIKIHDQVGKPNLNVIESPGSIMLHESAHKLHYYYLGTYEGVPGLTSPTNSFASDWKAAVGDISTCPYLPVNSDNVQWNDGTSDAQCGFIWAYGASDLTNFYEDVATMTQYYQFLPSAFATGDPAANPSRYQAKIALLKKYGFLQ